jgi:hypothetical protein
MGLNANSLTYLALAHARGIRFGNVLMIGRQSLTVTRGELNRILTLNLPESTKNVLRQLEVGRDLYSEQFFWLCGATSVDSMDKTAYEGATVLHDLNLPVPPTLCASYDLVVDGGSIEHVFNVPVVLTNYMKMLRTGGHYICNTATNNYSGHGFYQFSPEFFYAAFAEENGFEVVETCLYEENGRSGWYRLTPPANAARRLTFQNSVPAHLLVLARKTADVPVFTQAPQQRMYSAAWQDPSIVADAGGVSIKAFVMKSLAVLPPWVKWRVLNTWNTRNRFRPDLFTRVRPDDLLRP